VVAQGDRFGLRIVELIGAAPEDPAVPATPKRAAKGDAA
jgi:flagellar motor switch protein FliN